MCLISVLQKYLIYKFKCNTMVFIIFQMYKRYLQIYARQQYMCILICTMIIIVLQTFYICLYLYIRVNNRF